MKIFLSVLFFILFLVWTILLKNKKLEVIDNYVYKKIKFTKNKTLFFKIITNLASTIYFVILCSFLLIFLNNKRLALIISLLMIIDACIVFIIKNIIKRERPNIKRLVKEKGYSYPSGHTFSAICFYGFLIYILFKLPILIVLIMLIILIGISRIYLGVHYFSDVVGAILLSLSYLLLFINFLNICSVLVC